MIHTIFNPARIAAIAIVMAVGGCIEVAPPEAILLDPPESSPPPSAGAARAEFEQVVAAVEPVAERECRARTRGMNCDFLVLIDANPNLPPNAYQSLTPEGRPTLTFTQALLLDVRNRDELAFILGHEAAHHIEGHIAEQTRTVAAGALLGTILGQRRGASPEALDRLQRTGAFLGSRVFAQDKELEADALGTVIAAAAGFDPVLGSAYFTRIPDPGESLLGTHPPNAERQKIVRETAAAL